MKFAVLSDTHYISKSTLYGDGNKRDLLRHDINLAVFDELKRRTDIDTVLITGDLTDAGDIDSHLEFVEILRDLKNSGKRVFVLTATHDFHFSRAWVSTYGWPVRYRERPWEKPWCDLDKVDYKKLVTEEYSHLSPEECVIPVKPVAFPDRLWEIYREFGRDQAYSVCESAYSYAVKLDDGLRCVMFVINTSDNNSMHDASPT